MSVANKTVDQANIVGDTAVAGATEVSQATVEGVENVAASTGLVSQVSDHSNATKVSPYILGSGWLRLNDLFLCN